MNRRSQNAKPLVRLAALARMKSWTDLDRIGASGMAVRFAPILLLLTALARAAEGADANSQTGHDIFASATVPRFAITISPSEVDKLRKAHGPYVQAAITVDGRVFQDVGVRLKGQGSFRPVQDRPSLALKFDEFVPRQKFFGLPKIFLNNSSQDTTCLSEYLATSLFRDAGVPAARVTHARVELNGRDLGFYVLIEAMNKTFLRQHFRNADGNLYEGYARDVDQKLEQDSGKPGDQSDLQALVAAARLPASECLPRLRQVLDVDRFLSFLAISMLIAQHDSYPLNRNNYRLYQDPDTQRFVMIAHGIDGSFSRNTMPLTPPSKYLLTRAILQSSETRDLYRQRLTDLFTNVFRVDVMTNRIGRAAERLQAAAIDESERAGIAARTAAFLRRVQQRHDIVRHLFDNPDWARVTFGPDHAAALLKWEPQVESGTAVLDELTNDGTLILHLRAVPGNGAASVSSWRKVVRLDPGVYRLTGRVRVARLSPISTGAFGAALRISGGTPRRRVASTMGTEEWINLDEPFTVREGQEDVQCVCELRTTDGEAWFDSLKLHVLHE